MEEKIAVKISRFIKQQLMTIFSLFFQYLNPSLEQQRRPRKPPKSFYNILSLIVRGPLRRNTAIFFTKALTSNRLLDICII